MLDISTATPLLRRCYLGADLERAPSPSGGASVVAVAQASPAADAGLEVGDVIVQIAAVAVDGPSEALGALASLRPPGPFEVEIERRGARRRLRVPARPLPLENLSHGQIALDEVPTPTGRLRALLSLPDVEGPVPVVYLLQGATWASSEHPFEPRAPWRQLVDALTGAGFATYRVERSGVGDSEGPSCIDLDFEAELAGFVCGARRLASLPITGALYVFGWSLGGMLAPLVAREVDVERIAVFGTSQRRFTETHVAAGRRLWQRQGLEAHAIEANAARLEARLSKLRAGSDQRIEGRVAAFFRQLDEAKLAEAWSAVRCPVLSMHGDLDWITTEREAREISPERTLEIPHAAHDLTDARTGELSLGIVEALVAFYGDATPEGVRS